MTLDQSLALAALASLALGSAATAQNVHDPEPVVITDVRLSSEAEAPRVGLVLENGRIAQVLADGAEVPVGMRVIEAGGALALPAFVDAYTTRGCETEQPVATQDRDSSVSANVHIDMRRANRKGIHPSFRAVDVFNLEDEDLEAYRAQGFASLHTCPSGELLAGMSAVVTLREAALRDRVIAPEVFETAAFRASGRGYPGTLMAYHSQLRQFFLDARWHQERLERYAAGKLDRRPAFDRELDAIQPLLRGERRLLCRADNARDIRRWLKFAEAQGVHIAICGGGEAWKVAPELAAANVPVLLEIEWGKEVDDPDAKDEKEKGEPNDEGAAAGEGEEPHTGEELTPEEQPHAGEELTLEEPPVPEVVEDAQAEEGAIEDEEQAEEPSFEYEEPLEVRRERRRRWVETRDCALRLHEAGVVFALGSDTSKPKDMIKNVGVLVEAGLPAEAAIRALTETPALLLGVDGHIGKLEVGYDANIAIWSVSPFEKKAHLDWLFIDGARHEYEREDAESGKPGEGVDLSGTWSVTYGSQEGPPATLEISMDEEGQVTGSLSFTGPGGEGVKSEVSGAVSGVDFQLSASIEVGGFSAELRIDGEIEGDSISGDTAWKYSGGEETDTFTGTRKPKGTKEQN